MKVAFPDRVDNFSFTRTREERNLYETSEKITLLDVLYMLHELQKAYFAILGTGAVTITTETADTDASTTASLSSAVSSLSAQVAALSAQVAAVPQSLSGAGEPSDDLGDNGDWYWDTVGLYGYHKIGGSWRQMSS